MWTSLLREMGSDSNKPDWSTLGLIRVEPRAQDVCVGFWLQLKWVDSEVIDTLTYCTIWYRQYCNSFT